MRKPTEKQSIDDLFARKLGNMSLSPSSDGFERLQARMGQGRQETRVVFWKKPVVQRYMVAAACLLLVCSVGWFYQSSRLPGTYEAQVATNQSVSSKPPTTSQQPAPRQQAGVDLPAPEINTDQVARTEPIIDANIVRRKGADQAKELKTSGQSIPLKRDVPVLAQKNPAQKNHQLESINPESTNTATSIKQDQIVTNQAITRPAPEPERVLVVTIAEPAALVAARQTVREATEEKPVVAAADQPAKETKGNLWQQVKRIKQGEVFARHDNPNDDERGLLGRAYNGLKQNFEKDKPAKQ